MNQQHTNTRSNNSKSSTNWKQTDRVMLNSFGHSASTEEFNAITKANTNYLNFTNSHAGR